MRLPTSYFRSWCKHTTSTHLAPLQGCAPSPATGTKLLISSESNSLLTVSTLLIKEREKERKVYYLFILFFYIVGTLHTKSLFCYILEHLCLKRLSMAEYANAIGKKKGRHKTLKATRRFLRTS